ncbi:hypothetical protein BpHYR1_042859 [Brachionus plicatilis]|uniref:Uncharacterized protein n=1 Tax=Brachionus plicatilis TaxID=10195 RepID=A0A3M7PV96_BRAPC|nr:hypothetical protein BpHYR1_042859 [Brachionus plicatilis]
MVQNYMYVAKEVNPANVPKTRPIEDFSGNLKAKVYQDFWKAKKSYAPRKQNSHLPEQYGPKGYTRPCQMGSPLLNKNSIHRFFFVELLSHRGFDLDALPKIFCTSINSIVLIEEANIEILLFCAFTQNLKINSNDIK